MFEPPDDATVRVAHPVQVDGQLDARNTVFDDYETVQPFPQLRREAFGLDPAEAGVDLLEPASAPAWSTRSRNSGSRASASTRWIDPGV